MFFLSYLGFWRCGYFVCWNEWKNLLSDNSGTTVKKKEACSAWELPDCLELHWVVPEGLSFCATRIWKPGALCVVGSTGLSVKMIVAPGVMPSFALARNSVGSRLFCAASKRLLLDFSFPAEVTSTQRRCPSGSVPLSALKTRSFRGETACEFGIPARPISTPLR